MFICGEYEYIEYIYHGPKGDYNTVGLIYSWATGTCI